MISIIGVLATLILVGLRSTRNRARDVQIKSDITALNRAIVSYGAEHGDRYPISNCDQLDNNCDIRTVHSPAYGIEEVLSDTAYTGLKLIDGQYLNSVPVNKVNNSSYIYISKGNFFEVKSTLSTGDFFKFLTDSSNPDPISKIAKNKLGETQKIFSGMPGGIGSIILYPVWRSDQLAMWIDESGIVVTGSKVNLTKINWMPAYSINPPLKYKIYYKKNGDSSWLQGSDYVYTTQTSLAVQLDIADRWDFKIVAIDEGGIDSSQGTNPTLMDVNFSEDQLPIGGGGNPVKFYVCTNDGVNQGSLCSSDPPDRPDMVYIKTDVIFDPDQIDGISVQYKPTSSAVWYTVSSPNVTDGSPASPLAVLSLRKDTYDFRVYARLKNGKTGMLNYFTGGNTATVAMPVTASDKDDYEFPFFLGSSLDVSLADKGGGNYLMIWQPAFDNIGVVKYKVEITGTDVNISKDIDVPYINVDLTKSSNYTLKLTAYDEAGNSSVSVPKSITAP